MTLILPEAAKEAAKEAEKKASQYLVRSYSLMKCDFQLKLLDMHAMEVLELVPFETKQGTIQKITVGYRVIQLTDEQIEIRKAQLQDEKDKLLKEASLIT